MSSVLEQSETEKQAVPASEFARKFARYQDEAISGEIVKVSSHGRVIGAFISATDLDHYLELKRRERKVYVAGEIPEEIVEELKAANFGE